MAISWPTRAGQGHRRSGGEVNFGGDMVEHTIRTVEGGKNISFRAIRASRGKAVRAEPVQALYEQGRVHHVGEFNNLEDEMCNWVPGQSTWSPNRLDAAVWALTELMLKNVPQGPPPRSHSTRSLR
jgi:phage terminase large subunit-like protein